MMRPPIIHIAEDALARSVSSPAEAHALAAALREDPIWLETVPGLDSVAVLFDPLTVPLQQAEQALAAAKPKPIGTASLPALEIPVRYGGEHGPDLEMICAHAGLSSEAFIARHCAGTYSVDLIGFTPGFAYIGGLDASLSAPRLQTPRTRVPSGSVGIGAGYTGLYALQGPGGWPLIGRTDAVLFNADAAQPFLLRPGQSVRFVPA